MDTKTLEIKALDDEGHGLARFATLSAIDHDGDTYAPGAFGEQWAKILPAHDWTAVPLGKARIYEEGDAAFAELHLNLETQLAKDWHSALKFDLQHASAHPLQEWSYGFSIQDSSIETRDEERVRVIKRIKVHEVSPVVIGAGINTATLSMKHGARFAERISAVATAVREVTERAKTVIEMRAKEGRLMSPVSQQELLGVKTALDELMVVRDELVAVAAARDLADNGTAGRLAAEFAATVSRRWLDR